jgi:hypothetical protein
MAKWGSNVMQSDKFTGLGTQCHWCRTIGSIGGKSSEIDRRTCFGSIAEKTIT